MLRANRLGAAIERVSRRDVVLDIYTPCVPPIEAAQAQSGVTVRVHAAMPDELAATAKHAPKLMSAGSPYKLRLTLQKVRLADRAAVAALPPRLTHFPSGPAPTRPINLQSGSPSRLWTWTSSPALIST